MCLLLLGLIADFHCLVDSGCVWHVRLILYGEAMTEDFSLSVPLVVLLSVLSLKAEEPGGLSHLHPYYL